MILTQMFANFILTPEHLEITFWPQVFRKMPNLVFYYEIAH